jgi:Zn-dependent protease
MVTGMIYILAIILVAIIILVATTFVHEVGHLIAARAMGFEARFVVSDRGNPAVSVEADMSAAQRVRYSLAGPVGGVIASAITAAIAVAVGAGPFAFAVVLGAEASAVWNLLNLTPVRRFDGDHALRAWREMRSPPARH